MLTLSQVINHQQVKEFLKQTALSLAALAYTEHSFRHADLVAKRALSLAAKIGLPQREQELAGIAGYCHDMGNFLGRTQHHYWGALLFHQIFQEQLLAKELSLVIQGITNHDKEEMKLTNKVSAIIVLADKSDVHRSRVLTRSVEAIKQDIHDRVNYATTRAKLRVDKNKKAITLLLRIDTKFVPVMEYFEIFTVRMAYCREAARFLGYKFNLVINNFRLL